jgi:hypothetical protein
VEFSALKSVLATLLLLKDIPEIVMLCLLLAYIIPLAVDPVTCIKEEAEPDP